MNLNGEFFEPYFDIMFENDEFVVLEVGEGRIGITSPLGNVEFSQDFLHFTIRMLFFCATANLHSTEQTQSKEQQERTVVDDIIF
jgi:hypothetical protein